MKPEDKTNLAQRIMKENNNIVGIIIQKDKEVTYEQYFNGCHNHSYIHIYSVTKSIVSILIGIAIDKGYIQNVNQKILDFFPDYVIKKGFKK
jgi:CubicO group peptidase (beta-lactamase class C family)